MNNGNASLSPSSLLRSAPADSDFEKPIPVRNLDSNSAVDENVYNVDAEAAADIWTVSISGEDRLDQLANIPFLDSKSKDHYVENIRVVVSRDGGMGIELLELAGGREDECGLTIVSGVSGNAEKAGIIAGDSIASMETQKVTMSSGGESESRELFDCECKNFDTTIGLLSSFPSEIESLVLNVKRIRRWPKINIVVEYPPIQCAEGVDNKETVELFAGENLKQGLQTRGIIFEGTLCSIYCCVNLNFQLTFSHFLFISVLPFRTTTMVFPTLINRRRRRRHHPPQDRDAGKCDFCGGKCTVSIDMGMQLMNPIGLTEEKIMKNNPKCRLSCKTKVGYNMQEGDVRLRINLNEWTADDNKKSTSKNPFFSK